MTAMTYEKFDLSSEVANHAAIIATRFPKAEEVKKEEVVVTNVITDAVIGDVSFATQSIPAIKESTGPTRVEFNVVQDGVVSTLASTDSEVSVLESAIAKSILGNTPEDDTALAVALKNAAKGNAKKGNMRKINPM